MEKRHQRRSNEIVPVGRLSRPTNSPDLLVQRWHQADVGPVRRPSNTYVWDVEHQVDRGRWTIRVRVYDGTGAFIDCDLERPHVGLVRVRADADKRYLWPITVCIEPWDGKE